MFLVYLLISMKLFEPQTVLQNTHTPYPHNPSLSPSLPLLCSVSQYPSLYTFSSAGYSDRFSQHFLFKNLLLLHSTNGPVECGLQKQKCGRISLVLVLYIGNRIISTVEMVIGIQFISIQKQQRERKRETKKICNVTHRKRMIERGFCGMGGIVQQLRELFGSFQF